MFSIFQILQKNLNSLDETINKYSATAMAKGVVRNLKKLNELTIDEQISKLIYDSSPLPIMVMTAMVTDAAKEMERRKVRD